MQQTREPPKNVHDLLGPIFMNVYTQFKNRKGKKDSH